MKCATADCSNDARYINECGELCCGLCPIKQGLDSIRLADVGDLLIVTRALTFQADPRAIERCVARLRVILGQMP